MLVKIDVVTQDAFMGYLILVGIVIVGMNGWNPYYISILRHFFFLHPLVKINP